MSVWMCSGQGAQKPGMAVDLLDIPAVKEVFEAVSDAMGSDFIALVSSDDAAAVNAAIPAQVLTFATSVGIGRALQARGYAADAYVGFSLGQISALVLADVLSLEDGIALLKVRAEAMGQACEENPGAMVALMGGDKAMVEEFCNRVAEGSVLVPANFNAPGQIVVAGELDAIDRIEAAWKEAGNKAVRLATAGAFHSPLMQSASVAVAEKCATLDFAEPNAPVICNTDAREFIVDEAAERLSAQVIQGVQFQQSIESLIEQGEREFVEIGFGGVLNNLIRRIDKTVERWPVGNRKQLDAFIEAHPRSAE